MMMVDAGDADGVVAGLRAYYPATIKPALQIVGRARACDTCRGMYMLMFKNRMLFLADTTVNIDPTAARRSPRSPMQRRRRRGASTSSRASR